MGYSILVISKELPQMQELIDEVINIATNQGLNIAVDESQERIAMNTKEQTGEIEIYWFAKPDFDESIKQELFPDDQGRVMVVNFNYENQTIVPFFRELLTVYSDWKIYNDEVDGEPLVFGKSDFDSFTSTDAYVCLFNPGEPIV